MRFDAVPQEALGGFAGKANVSSCSGQSTASGGGCNGKGCGCEGGQLAVSAMPGAPTLSITGVSAFLGGLGPRRSGLEVPPGCETVSSAEEAALCCTLAALMYGCELTDISTTDTGWACKLDDCESNLPSPELGTPPLPGFELPPSVPVPIPPLPGGDYIPGMDCQLTVEMQVLCDSQCAALGQATQACLPHWDAAKQECVATPVCVAFNEVLM